MNANSCAYTASDTLISTYGYARGYTPGVKSPISGAHIVALREKAKFKTQGDLAAKAGMDPSKLSRLENDKPVNMTLKSLQKLAAALKVSPRDLFDQPSPEGEVGHVGSSDGAGLADSLRRAIAEQEQTGQFPNDWRGDIMLAVFTLTRALQRQAAPANAGGQTKEAQR